MWRESINDALISQIHAALAGDVMLIASLGLGRGVQGLERQLLDSAEEAHGEARIRRPCWDEWPTAACRF